MIAATEPRFGQTALRSRGGMVTSNHRLAAEAGAAMLARGGNAVDAAVATAFAVGVVEPAMSGIGGRGYLLIHSPKDGTTATIDGHERAPLASRPDMYRVEGQDGVPTQGWGPQVPVAGSANTLGHLAVAVPGVVGALAVAHRKYGRLPLASVIEPAIGLADDGFEVTVPLATAILTHRAKLARFEATAAVFLPGGLPPNPGVRLRQPDLARTFRLIATDGPEAFYTGEIARAIAAEMRRAGGNVSEEDLARFEPREWDRPLKGAYRGHTVLTMPEATGGVTLLQILNLLEGYDVSRLAPDDPAYLHLVLEACRLAFRDRLACIEDPAFAPVPYAGLVSKAFAADRRGLIDPNRTLGDVAPGDAWPFDESGRAGMPVGPTVSRRPADTDTTHFCAVDRDGTVVSMTQSIIDAFGSGVVVPGTGMLLNSAMHNFNPAPGRLGSVAPWKRSCHYGTPVIVLGPDGAPRVVIGGAGGTKIVTGVAQILIHVLDRGFDPQAAVEAPRVHNEGWESEVDSRFPAAARDRLAALGHRFTVVRAEYARPAFSRINAITFDAGSAASGVDQFGDAGAAVVTSED